MQYKVLKIEEDMDFGCEERQPGEALMSVVLMEDENRNETSLRHDVFIDQWEDAQDHKPALVGIVCSVICLVIFGSGKFILPSMASIVLCFLGMKKHEEKRKKERIQKSGEYQA
mgnify:CR=1 FL=1